MSDRATWISLVTALNRLTQEGKIDWSVFNDGTEYRATYKQREFLLSEDQEEIEEDTVAKRIAAAGRSHLPTMDVFGRPSKRHRPVARLRVKDKKGFVACPTVPGLDDLYRAAERSVIDLGQIVRDLSEE